MYVAIVPNRSSRPAILLRESYRDGAKVKNRTLANLSDWPAERIETLRAALRLLRAPTFPTFSQAIKFRFPAWTL